MLRMYTGAWPRIGSKEGWSSTHEDVGAEVEIKDQHT